MNARRAALLEAADFVEFYGAERLALCNDSILFDPVLGGRDRSARAFAKSRELQVDGTINSSAYHAAKDIAEHLRRMADRP